MWFYSGGEKGRTLPGEGVRGERGDALLVGGVDDDGVASPCSRSRREIKEQCGCEAKGLAGPGWKKKSTFSVCI